VNVVERLRRRDHRETPDGAEESVSLAPMRRGDLRRGVLDIEAAGSPRPWSVNVFRSELDQMRSGTRSYLVARRDGQIVGYAGLWFAAGEAHVTNIAVRPSDRRSGVATRLLLALADVAIERGCSSWTLEVRASSTGAQALYRRFGFAPAGVRTRYYENVEDAIVMWCHDIGRAGYRSRLDEIAAALDGGHRA
jgi:ribosomal-protein-alanine N-acetyltransferase